MKFPFTQEFQTLILSHIVHSDQFIADVRDRIRPDHFASNEQWIICTLAYEHFDRYKCAPANAIVQEAGKYARRTNMADAARMLLTSAIENLDPDTQPSEYLLNEVHDFIRHEEVRRVLEEFIPQYNRGEYDIDRFVKSLGEVQKVDGAQDNGNELVSTAAHRVAHRFQRRAMPIPTLIEPLDEIIGGIRTGQLATILAPSGIGKSFMLAHLGKAGLTMGKTVFHYTLEMTELEVMERYDQMMIGTNRDGLFRPGASSAVTQAYRRMAKRGGKLFVTYLSYPTPVADLLHDVRRKAELYGPPHLVIVDYGELMTIGKTGAKMDKYREYGEVWRELKALAVEAQTGVWVATQAAKTAVGAKRVSEIEVSDSYEKIRVSDIVIGFNRNVIYNRKTHEWKEIDEEEGYGPDVFRLFVVKHRGKEDKKDVRIRCDLDRSLFYWREGTQMLKRTKDGKRDSARGEVAQTN